MKTLPCVCTYNSVYCVLPSPPKRILPLMFFVGRTFRDHTTKQLELQTLSSSLVNFTFGNVVRDGYTYKVDTSYCSCLLDCFPGWSKCWQDSGKRFFCWNAEAQNSLRGKSWSQLMKQSTTTRLVVCGILCTNSITLATSLCDFWYFCGYYGI